MIENAIQIHAGHRNVVLRRINGERLCDEDTGVVDQRVDPAEARYTFLNDAMRCRWVKRCRPPPSGCRDRPTA